jgi:hypothetical protein
MKKINVASKANSDTSNTKILLYTNRKGNVELRADIKKDTLWATQEQIARLFQVSIPNINIHLGNIFKTRELSKNSVIKDFLITAADGKKYKVKSYNLDAIIAVGYRVNSKKATKFRIWATGILREHITKGYSLNKHVLIGHPERLEGIHEALAFMESPKHPGKIKGKIILKVTKEVEK